MSHIVDRDGVCGRCRWRRQVHLRPAGGRRLRGAAGALRQLKQRAFRLQVDTGRATLRPQVLRWLDGQAGGNRRLVGTDVVDLGPRALVGPAYLYLLAGERLCDLTGGVLEVAGDDRLRRTDDDARREQAAVGTVRAVVALGSRMAARVNVERVVGTSLHARLAADAAVGVEIDDAIRPLVERHRWADLDTRRILAMLAPLDRKVPPRIGKGALLDVFDPGSEHTERHVVLGLAGHRAGVAANALALVDDKPVSGQFQSLPAPDGRFLSEATGDGT